LDINNDSVAQVPTAEEIAKFEGASESMLHSTLQEIVDPNQALTDGGSQYIYEQFNEQKSTATAVVDLNESQQQLPCQTK